MDMMQILVVLVFSSAFMLLLWWIRASILTTIRKDIGAEVYLVLTGVRKANDLERFMRTLMWQRSRIGYTSTIIIVDDGLSNEARLMAEIFAEENDYIEFFKA